MTSATRTLWIGTYPHPAIDAPEGVWRVTLDAASGSFVDARQAVASPSPSFVALAGSTLYAVGEDDEGTLSAFSIEPDVDDGAGAGDTLRRLGPPVPTGGSFPCHVVALPGAVAVANYGSGSLAVVPTGPDGALSGPARVQAHEGSGPDTDRQEGPHAHFVATPVRESATGHVLVTDLGADVLLRHDPAAPGPAAAGAAASVAATFPPGTGPRHVAELPSGHLVVVGELDPALFVLAPTGEGTYDVVSRHDATPEVAADGGPHLPSHVAVAADGTRVLVAVRGSDVLAVHAVEHAPDGTPTLRHLADTPVGGAWPRHFAVLAPADPFGAWDLVVVANQNDLPDELPEGDQDGVSTNLALLRVDRASGEGELADVLTIPSPSCVVEA